MSDQNGKFKSFLLQHWVKALTILFGIATTFIGLKATIFKQEVVAEITAVIMPKVIDLETYKNVHDNEHTHLARELADIKDICKDIKTELGRIRR